MTTLSSDGGAPATVMIIGAGCRGMIYASFATKFSDLITVVAVADTSAYRRQKLARRHNIPAHLQFTSWEQAAAAPKVADAVVIGLQDALHAEAVAAFSKYGYHILCEKPMATTIADCVKMYKNVQAPSMQNKTFAIGHVLRYSPYNQAVKAVIDSGVLGTIIDIQHLEPIGNQHFAHSYVRGHWGNEDAATFSLMAKCCHDIDILSYYMSGRVPKQVQSYGQLNLFKKSNKPPEAGAAMKCLDCPYERHCAWSAKKIYVDDFEEKKKHWRVHTILDTDTMEEDQVVESLKTSKFGGCVYEANNNVVDHQTVNLLYDDGATISMVMSAFSEAECDRSTRIAGTKGELIGDMNSFTVFDFVTRTKTRHEPQNLGGSHGGGDELLSKTFYQAVGQNDPKILNMTAEDILNAHLIVFAAESSRKGAGVVDFGRYKEECLSGKREDHRM